MKLKKILTWAAVVVLVVAVVGFLAFLYLIPPFTLQPPEAFIEPERNAAPALDSIADPKTRAIAERGKYIVMTTGCVGCHVAPGDAGPIWEQYLAGGAKATFKGHGTFISANLTPDPATGLARRSDDDVKRVLRSGISADQGRQLWYRDMPWAWFSNWTEEDRQAVVVYLRHIKAIRHRIPQPPLPDTPGFVDRAANEQADGGDFGTAQ
jgi:hypothetical protein